jgi:hypothetical protein
MLNYSGINYILNLWTSFCGLVETMGLEKFSLEALDSIFNGRQWNHNII